MFLTVGLPIYNSKEIAWLSMESLCRQENPGCEWELIVCEDRHTDSAEYLNEGFFLSYKQRLNAAGCVRILYISPLGHVKLANKWKMMALAADDKSEYFLLQGADDYSPAKRLVDTVSAADGLPTVIAYRDAFAFDIIRNKFSYFRNDSDTFRLFMAVRTPLIQKINESELKSGIDHYIVEELKRISGNDFVKKQIQCPELRAPHICLFTDGFNSISQTRYRYYDKGNDNFHKTESTLREACDSETAECLEKISRRYDRRN